VTYLAPNIRGILKPRGGLERRVNQIVEKFDGDTQRIRGQLIAELEALVDVANEKAINITNPKQWKQRQNWVRLAAYIAQVINSISKTYDLAQIKQELEELRKIVREMRRHELGKGEEGDKPA